MVRRYPIIAICIALIFPLFGLAAGFLTQATNSQSTMTWMMLLIITLAVAFVLGLVYFRQYERETAGHDPATYTFDIGSPIGRWLIIIGAFLLLFPSILSRLLSVRMQLARHGNEHAGYFFQLINGISPPENQTFPGAPANGYWLFHALVATLSNLTDIAPTLIATLVHAVVLILTIMAMRGIITLLFPGERRYGVILLLTLFALFGMNPLGSFHWLALNGAAGLSADTIWSLQPVALFGIARLTHLLTYYLAISGFALGVLCYVLTLLFVLRVIKGSGGVFDLLFAIIASFGVFAFHPISGVFIFTVIPIALAATYLADAYFQGYLLDFSRHKQRAAELQSLIKTHKAWTAVLSLLVLIIGLVWFSFLFGASNSIDLSPGIDLISSRQVLSIFSMTSLLIPFFLIGVYQIYKTREPTLVFLLMVTFFGFVLAYFARVFNNEYKFIYLSTIIVSLICTLPIHTYLFAGGEKKSIAGRAYAVLLFGLMFINILTIGTSRLFNPAVTADNFQLNGTHVESRFAHQGDLYPEADIGWIEDGTYYPAYDLIFADVYQWARDNSQPQAVLVLPFYHKDDSTMLIVSERLPYVVDGYFFNNGLPGYEARVNQVNTIYSEDSSWAEKSQAIDAIAGTFPERQLLLLYPHALNDMLANEGSNGLLPLYQGRYADLYEIEK